MTPEQENIISTLTPDELEFLAISIKLQIAESKRLKIEQQKQIEIDAIATKYVEISNDVNSELVATRQEFEFTKSKLFPEFSIENTPIAEE